jgi:hypothetical protein
MIRYFEIELCLNFKIFKRFECDLAPTNAFSAWLHKTCHSNLCAEIELCLSFKIF